MRTARPGGIMTAVVACVVVFLHFSAVIFIGLIRMDLLRAGLICVVGIIDIIGGLTLRQRHTAADHAYRHDDS